MRLYLVTWIGNEEEDTWWFPNKRDAYRKFNALKKDSTLKRGDIVALDRIGIRRLTPKKQLVAALNKDFTEWDVLDLFDKK